MQRGIFFQNSVDRDADLVFVGAGLGLNRKSDGRFGNGCALIKNRSGFIAKRLAGSGFFQFCDRTNIAGMKLLHFNELFTLHDLRVLKSLRHVAVVIHQRGVIFQHAAHHFEIVDAARRKDRPAF